MPRRSLTGCGRTPATGAWRIWKWSRGGSGLMSIARAAQARDFVEFISKLEDPDRE